MKIHTVVVGAFEVNCFVVEAAGSEAIIIDPGDDAGTISAFLRKHKITPRLYLLTHGHIDHISALADLVKSFPAPVTIHKEDLAWAFSPQNAMPPFYTQPKNPGKIERVLDGACSFSDIGLEYSVIPTPGHTPGSVCFHFPSESAIFTGDTLFAGSAGRTDLNGGNSRHLSRSLRRLKELPDSTAVYPGHGPATDIGTENKTNYFMQII